MTINYYTRSQEGLVHDHFEDIQSALEYFTSSTGYRLDFIFPDGRVLFIYRSEYWEEINPDVIQSYQQRNMNLALAKVLFHDPTKTLSKKDNVVYVDF